MTVLPEQISVGPVIAVVSPGPVLGVTCKVSFELVPHASVALTITIPGPVPIVAVSELVVLNPLQPVPTTVQLYPVIPATTGTEKTPVLEVHTSVGEVMGAGVAGPALGVIVIV